MEAVLQVEFGSRRPTSKDRKTGATKDCNRSTSSRQRKLSQSSEVCPDFDDAESIDSRVDSRLRAGSGTVPGTSLPSARTCPADALQFLSPAERRPTRHGSIAMTGYKAPLSPLTAALTMGNEGEVDRQAGARLFDALSKSTSWKQY